jgi:hypothetical protein
VTQRGVFCPSWFAAVSCQSWMCGVVRSKPFEAPFTNRLKNATSSSVT